jgi:hypothetical protein
LVKDTLSSSDTFTNTSDSKPIMMAWKWKRNMVGCDSKPIMMILKILTHFIGLWKLNLYIAREVTNGDEIIWLCLLYKITKLI